MNDKPGTDVVGPPIGSIRIPVNGVEQDLVITDARPLLNMGAKDHARFVVMTVDDQPGTVLFTFGNPKSSKQYAFVLRADLAGGLGELLTLSAKKATATLPKLPPVMLVKPD